MSIYERPDESDATDARTDARVGARIGAPLRQRGLQAATSAQPAPSSLAED
ncbi:MAG: hypothetical protein KAI47_16105 [Deltaproteobacteria bacterium]|nr:hypothetical protein [Deltaproteobacteria bacterium]